ETRIFDQTRAWLNDDPSHIFHLVVDELHTYRGTAGTEVAYLLRCLYDRLGLTPDSQQLRIIASSASLDDDPSGMDYLEQFFGRSRNGFRFVSGDIDPPLQTAATTVLAQSVALRQLHQAAESSSGTLNEASAREFSESVGCAPLPSTASAKELLASAL